MEEIKAGDIMLGNWFIGYDGKPFQWSIDDLVLVGRNEYPHPIDEIIKSPIPLTEEILIKAGFEKEYEDDRYGRVFLVPNTKYIIRMVNYGNPQKVDFGYSFEISDDKNWSDIKRIYFLHDLQNLYFALTGEEIKIDVE